jgi:hypothetical protein
MLGVPVSEIDWHHDCSDGAQTLYEVSCFVEPPHMGVTGGKKPIGHRVMRERKPRHQELFEGVVKLPIEKMGLADTG